MRFEYTPLELARPFRDPLSVDAAGRGGIGSDEMHRSPRRLLFDALGELLLWMAVCALLAAALSLAESVVSRTLRAFQIRPCRQFSLACLQAWVDAAQNGKALEYSGLLATLRAPLVVIAMGLVWVLLFAFVAARVARAIEWLLRLEDQEFSRWVLLLQQGLLDPGSSARRRAAVHGGMALALGLAGIAPFVLLDLRALMGLALDVPDYVTETHRLRFYKSMPLVGCLMIFGFALPNFILELREVVRHLWRPQPDTLVPWRPAADVDGPTIRIAHWSDLHLTRPGCPTIEGPAGGNDALAALVAKFEPLLSSVDVLLITGDMTDAGLAEEWQEFFHLLPEGLLGKVVLVPGNHDINIVSTTRRTAVESSDQVGFQLRLVRFLAVLDAVQGHRAWVWKGRFGPVSLRAALRDRRHRLNSFADDLAGRNHGEVLAAWRGCFPMVVDVPGSDFSIVIFDSIAYSRNLAGNSLGWIRQQQLDDFEQLALARPGRRHVFALHHHLALPPVPLRGKALLALQQFFLVLLNARRVLRTLGRFEPAVVLHGHRHVGFEGSFRALDIVSARSTTLGCELKGETRPGFQVLEVGRCGRGASIKSVETHAL